MLPSNPTRIRLTWEEPLRAPGAVTHYLVYYGVDDGRDNVVYAQVLSYLFCYMSNCSSMHDYVVLLILIYSIIRQTSIKYSCFYQ